jgi:hypothetical protein
MDIALPLILSLNGITAPLLFTSTTQPVPRVIFSLNVTIIVCPGAVVNKYLLLTGFVLITVGLVVSLATAFDEVVNAFVVLITAFVVFATAFVVFAAAFVVVAVLPAVVTAVFVDVGVVLVVTAFGAAVTAAVFVVETKFVLDLLLFALTEFIGFVTVGDKSLLTLEFTLLVPLTVAADEALTFKIRAKANSKITEHIAFRLI